MTRVDIHAHCFPGAYLDLLARFGSTSAHSLKALGAGDGADELSVRFEAMAGAGVGVQVLSLSSQGPYLADVDQAVAAAQLANDIFVDLAKQHEDRLRALAVLPLPHMDAALKELDRILDQPGIVGIAVSTSIIGRSIADELFEPIYAELDRRSAVLFVHPAGQGASSPLIESTGLTWPIGAPIEDTISVTHLLARNIPTRYSRLKIVNAHLGGAVPMLIARLDRQFPRLAPGAEAPSIAARRMWYDTVCHGHLPALLAAQASFGAERLILGTDFPFVNAQHYQAAVSWISDARLPSADAEAILDRNGATVLGL